MIHKQILSKDLANVPVLYVDTAPLSSVFLISQFKETWTAGKNSFFIKGSDLLNVGSEVLVEITDANGEVVFFQPIRNYQESLSRMISVEIYEDTAIGPGKITILGILNSLPNGQSIPSEWAGRYNVKWTSNIFIDRRLDNFSPIKLYERPEATISEVLNVYRTTPPLYTIITGSIATALSGTIVQQPVISNVVETFLLRSSTSFFTKAMTDGTFQTIVNGVPFTSSIKRVWNSTIAELSSSYVESGTYMPFIVSNYTMSYFDTPSYLLSQHTKSFAVVDVTNLQTFSGKIHRLKTYVRSIDSPTEYELISDSPVTAKNLLQTSSFNTGEPNLEYGFITSQSIIDTYWSVGTLPTTGSY